MLIHQGATTSRNQSNFTSQNKMSFFMQIGNDLKKNRIGLPNTANQRVEKSKKNTEIFYQSQNNACEYITFPIFVKKDNKTGITTAHGPYLVYIIAEDSYCFLDPPIANPDVVKNYFDEHEFAQAIAEVKMDKLLGLME